MILTLRPLTAPRRWRIGVAMGMLGVSIALAACGSSGTGPPPSAGNGVAASAPTAVGPVLPVDANPIMNRSTTQALVIESVLVENNTDPATGTAAPDHLEIAMRNSGTSELTGFEVFYTYDDPTTGVQESYYAKLPDSFRIPAGGSRVAHFDNTGAVDHFPDNEFSLYHTSRDALEVTVEVSAVDAAPQMATAHKDAGGEEVAD